ncbi:Sds3-like-domain-containing protein [Entophlyctis helioformis]|nr:Sds3-like-domain-containing protein [Entophlyctis helioformis]
MRVCVSACMCALASHTWLGGSTVPDGACTASIRPMNSRWRPPIPGQASQSTTGPGCPNSWQRRDASFSVDISRTCKCRRCRAAAPSAAAVAAACTGPGTCIRLWTGRCPSNPTGSSSTTTTTCCCCCCIASFVGHCKRTLGAQRSCGLARCSLCIDGCTCIGPVAVSFIATCAAVRVVCLATALPSCICCRDTTRPAASVGGTTGCFRLAVRRASQVRDRHSSSHACRCRSPHVWLPSACAGGAVCSPHAHAASAPIVVVVVVVVVDIVVVVNATEACPQAVPSDDLPKAAKAGHQPQPTEPSSAQPSAPAPAPAAAPPAAARKAAARPKGSNASKAASATASTDLRASSAALVQASPRIQNNGMNSVAGDDYGWDANMDEDYAQDTAKKDRRQRELHENLNRLDRSFLEHKDEIFHEKINAFKSETREIQQGIHPEYLEAFSMLERERDLAIKQAELFRDYELECAQRIYQLEYEASLAEFNAERDGLREKMLQELDEKKRKLKDDRDSFDVSNDASLENMKAVVGTRKATRQTVQRVEEQQKKEKRRKAPNGPVLVFQLKDHEIYDDLGVLRRVGGLTHNTSRKAGQGYKKK